MPQLTAAQLEQHPELPHVTWPLQPTQRGKVTVAHGRGGPFNIAYEIHGRGPKLLLLIMGLGAMKSVWQRQTKDFGHTRADRYSVLVFDNRGIGESDKPLMRYSTSEMARDTLELLEHVGWTRPRSLNVVGISMGGMIAQELALMAPTRIASLTLVSTAARLRNTIGYLENLRNRISILVPKSLDRQIANTKYLAYTQGYVNGPDITEAVVQSFPTGGDRAAAGELAKRRDTAGFTRAGFLAQAVAAGWHFKSGEDVSRLADLVGRERICVMHGTEDRMITFPHGEVLAGELGEGVRVEFLEGQSHVIPIERREMFLKVLEEMVERTEALG